MPTIFEYLGIIIRFYSNEHEPIHVHAIYDKSVMKVNFFIDGGKIYRITYVTVKGEFSAQKTKQLKKFIDVYKEQIVDSWSQYFIWKKKISKKTITKQL